jgi:hypothetical protein
VIKTPNYSLGLRFINHNIESQEYEKTNKLGNMSLPNINSSTIKNLNDSGVDELLDSKQQW